MRSDIDQRGIRNLVREPALYEQMLNHARRAATLARAIAPADSGEYKRRIFARRANNAWASAYYGSESYKAWWVEFGSRNNRAHHTLERAGRLAGLKMGQIHKPDAKSGIGAI